MKFMKTKNLSGKARMLLKGQEIAVEKE